MLCGEQFIEVFVNASIEVCRARDTKGLYRELGEELTGPHSPYEVPVEPEVLLNTENTSVDQNVAQIIEALVARGALPRGAPA
jgi:adenylylsulfate kinase